MNPARYLADCLPGVTVAAMAPGLVLFDSSARDDHEGDAFGLERVDSPRWQDDGLLATFPTVGAALLAHPALIPCAGA